MKGEEKRMFSQATYQQTSQSFCGLNQRSAKYIPLPPEICGFFTSQKKKHSCQSEQGIITGADGGFCDRGGLEI